jgi:Domain of unknown function (DUF3291)
MSDWHLAQLNIARLRVPIDHPDTAEFVAGLDPINARADSFPGFVWRMEDESGNATGIETPGDPGRINNMSVWESVEALRAFTYDAAHVDYMRRRLDWFEKRTGPHFVMWWIPAGHIPTLEEADQRLHLLTENGPSAEAFTNLLTFAPPS